LGDGADGRCRRPAQRTFEAAADTYDAPANGFWALTGRRTIGRLELERGARVLDLPCGSGASALPAAEAVGPTGSVVAVDLSAGLLGLARAEAHAAGLRNLRFLQADMRATGLPTGRSTLSCASSACSSSPTVLR
jgi:ubiquinone/menaquinone biosynthesis C-methylase UbiE